MVKDAPIIQTNLSFVEIGALQMIWKDDANRLGVFARLLPAQCAAGITVEAFVPRSTFNGVTAGRRLGYLDQAQFDRVVQDCVK
jgi:hypothetical protein